jgi:RimJ/RimL family protein N-acetyltransferase
MNLIPVYERPDRHELLYKLLSERDAEVNISHSRMPCWGDHIRFVESRPYEAWYFIGDEPLGACYLSKQNEIGVFLFREHQGKGHGRDAIKAIMEKHGRRRYLANVSPQNDRSRFLFAGLGFKCVQQTYELTA